MQFTEKEIIEGCIKGKRKAQKALFEKYHKVMLGICLRYANSYAEAEDVLIEGFMQVFKKIKTYKGTGSFEGWMKRLFVNRAIDNFRKNKKLNFYEDLENVQNKFVIQNNAHDILSKKELLQTIQELPPGYRIVFNLYAIEGYSHKEIAEKLNISESTSKTQLMKAKNRLAKKINEMNNFNSKVS